MKKITIILIAAITLGGMVNEAKAQGYGGISFTTFYNELSPYGRWVMDPQYGQVWIADAPGFEPYYDNGRWVYTSYGWTWASDYPWGWAPFHYGRWTYLPMWGWAWVPGYQWGPAWVGWCQNDGYYGWAPLGPGMGFNFSYHSIPYNYWRFVPQQYVTGPSFHNHIIRPVREQNEFRKMNIINNIQVNNQVTYLAGPKREAVERVTGERITARPVAFTGTDERTRVDSKEVRMYRPDLKPGNGVGGKNIGVKPPLPNVTTAPATVVQPTVTQPAEPITRRDNDRAVKPLPVAPKQDNQTAMEEQQVNNRLPNEREATREQMEKNRALKTTQQQLDERRQQRVQEQLQRELQMQAQREQQQNELQSQRALQEQLRQQQVQEQRMKLQQAIQQQNEQRQSEIRQQQQAQKEQQLQEQQQQNEIRRQQLQEQKMQQRMMQQQQNQQRQNEIRQQPMQEAPMRPQRETPVNQRPRSGKPNEN